MKESANPVISQAGKEILRPASPKNFTFAAQPELMRRILLSFLMLSASVAVAQKPPIKFGDIPIEDMKMNVYPSDSSAAAVVLADYGESNLVYSEDHGFQIKFDRLRRIKILNKEGLEWADFSIQLYHESGNYEKLMGLRAVTYNLENGKVMESKLKNEAILKEKYDGNFEFTKVPWTNVKVGSVLEISYTITSDFLFNFRNWEFQSTIPTRWSEYRAGIPEYYFYEKYLQGYVPLEINEATSKNSAITFRSKGESDRLGRPEISSERVDYKENRFRWAAKNVPALKPEPYMTTYRDFISKMIFELSYSKFPNSPTKQYMGSWGDISRSYNKSFDEVILGNSSLKETADQVTAGKTSDEEKLNAILEFVKKNVVWDGTNRKFPNSTLKKVLDEKAGNSAEINLLLACLLEKAGIKFQPVLISTRDHGFVREATPVSSQFNYVAGRVKLGDKTFLLDATDKFLPTGLLPERCLNGKGFVVSEEGFQWISLQPATKTRTVYTLDLSLTGEGEFKGKLKVDRSGYNSVEARKSYLSNGESGYVKNFFGGHPWEYSKSEFLNANEIQLPFKESHEIVINEHAIAGGGTLYFNPFILAREQENPFKQEKRNYPVDFGTPFEMMYMIKVNLPPDHVVEELPKSKVIVLPNNAAKYMYNIGQVGNSINISSSLTIGKSIFTQDEYPNLREFYGQVIAKQAEQIVLKKK